MSSTSVLTDWLMEGWMDAAIYVVRVVDLGTAVRVKVRADSFIIFIGPLHLFKLCAWFL